MRQDATPPWEHHVDEERYMWGRLYTEPPWQSLPPPTLSTIPSRSPDVRVPFTLETVTLAFPWESIEAPAPLSGLPSLSAVGAESSYMPMLTATSSILTAYDGSTSLNFESAPALRVQPSPLSEMEPVNLEELRYGLSEGETAHFVQDQEPPKGGTLEIGTPSTPKPRGQRLSGGQARKFASSRTSPATGGGFGAGWTAHEQEMVAQVMTEMVQERQESLGKEERWEEAARRLRLLNVNRTAAGIKNHWNRVGRAASQVDERQVPNPQRMKTGLQARSKAIALREKRRLASAVTKEKKKAAGKS